MLSFKLIHTLSEFELLNVCCQIFCTEKNRENLKDDLKENINMVKAKTKYSESFKKIFLCFKIALDVSLQ